MRKFLFVILLIVLALGILPVSAAPPAQMPADELAALAKYFPAESPLFATIRTDDAFIETLDGLLASILGKLPEGLIPPQVALRALLDMGSQQVAQGDFTTAVRPWLGDTVAVGFLNAIPTGLGGSPEASVVIGIRDRAAATEFMHNFLLRMNAADEIIINDDVDGFTVFRPADTAESGIVAINDEAMIVAGMITAVPIGGFMNGPLSEDAHFQESTALLPAGGYNGLLFLKTSDLLGPAASFMAPPGVDGEAFAGLIGSQVVGLTLLDGRSLVADVAWNMGDAGVLESLGMNTAAAVPVDPAFAAYLPGNASLVLHGANFKGLYDNLVTSMRAQMPSAEFDQQMEQARAALRNFMQLDLDEDVLSWLTGDFAFFMSLDLDSLLDAFFVSMESGAQLTMNRLPFDFGLVIEATDPAKAQRVATAIGSLLPVAANQSPEASVTQQQIGGTDVTVLSMPVPLSPQMSVPFELVLGANENIFLLASRPAAEMILSGTNALSGSAAFSEAASYLLPGSTSVWYADSTGMLTLSSLPTLVLLGPAIGNVFDNIVAELENPTARPTKTAEEIEAERQAQLAQNRMVMDTIQAVRQMINSGTISSATTADGDVLLRFVITFAP